MFPVSSPFSVCSTFELTWGMGISCRCHWKPGWKLGGCCGGQMPVGKLAGKGAWAGHGGTIPLTQAGPGHWGELIHKLHSKMEPLNDMRHAVARCGMLCGKMWHAVWQDVAWCSMMWHDASQWLYYVILAWNCVWFAWHVMAWKFQPENGLWHLHKIATWWKLSQGSAFHWDIEMHRRPWQPQLWQYQDSVSASALKTSWCSPLALWRRRPKKKNYIAVRPRWWTLRRSPSFLRSAGRPGRGRTSVKPVPKHTLVGAGRQLFWQITIITYNNKNCRCYGNALIYIMQYSPKRRSSPTK